ncbi:MAG TPA: hypothetical protein VEA69_22610 [Tepidisphaeraceae bacterium]|nr:hypothetical protein [Tepidisphaeraceae bacterium]
MFRPKTSNDYAAARALGWASIGIGLTELLAPRQLEEAMGIDPDDTNTNVLRALGVRELAHGVDCLTRKDPTYAVWGRVVGDVLDTALLGVVGAKTRNPAGFAAIATSVMAIGIADVVVAMRLTSKRRQRQAAESSAAANTWQPPADQSGLPSTRQPALQTQTGRP